MCKVCDKYNSKGFKEIFDLSPFKDTSWILIECPEDSGLKANICDVFDLEFSTASNKFNYAMSLRQLKTLWLFDSVWYDQDKRYLQIRYKREEAYTFKLFMQTGQNP